MKDFNFIRSSREEDKDLFFGPLSVEDDFVELEPHMNMAHVLALAGVFKSATEARKNGKGTPIPTGFSDGRYGKLKTRITILNTKEC